jgi:hypothetical protein
MAKMLDARIFDQRDERDLDGRKDRSGNRWVE